jgi:hypothetical protein
MRTGCFIVAEMRRGGGVGANKDHKKGLFQFNPSTISGFEFGSIVFGLSILPGPTSVYVTFANIVMSS